jgi:hypothetical protein
MIVGRGMWTDSWQRSIRSALVTKGIIIDNIGKTQGCGGILIRPFRKRIWGVFNAIKTP